MKKIIIVILLVFSLFLIACTQDKTNDGGNNGNTVEPDPNVEPEGDTVDYEKIINDALNAVTLPSEVTTDITLLTSLSSDKYNITLTWESNSNAITSSGVVTQLDDDAIVTLKVKATLEGKTIEKEFTVKVLKKEKVVDYNAIFDDAVKEIVLPTTLEGDYEFPKTLNYQEYEIALEFYSDVSNIDPINNKVTLPYEDDLTASIEVKLSLNGTNKKYDFGQITILSLGTLCQRTMDKIDIPAVVNDDLELIESDGVVTVEWRSSKSRVLSDSGVCAYVSSDTSVVLSCTVYIEGDSGDYFLDKEFNITVTRWAAEKRFNLALEKISIPKSTIDDLTLPTQFDYDVLCRYQSSEEDIITNFGRVTQQATDEQVVLTATLYTTDSTDTKELVFVITVPKYELTDERLFKYHNLLVYAKDFDTSKMSNMVYDQTSNRIKLASGALTGEYESIVYKVSDVYEIVGSYSCLTSASATCEVSYSLRVNGTWSKYFSYGEWGLGKSNYYYDQSDSLVSMSVDEIQVKNSKYADGIKFKVKFKRTSDTVETPALSMVACALFKDNYTYSVDTSKILPEKDWDVPKLYQHDVPQIGGVICSPTTTTMLLKFKGLSFTDKGYKYEHEYIARMAADPGHNSPTYGNWSYNMITAGAFGVNAYVARMYSWDEVKYHLCTVGPIGASIRGNFGIYSTGGHLIVVRGYREEMNQIGDPKKTIVICNDPNVSSVYYEVTLEIFMGAWRNTAYVIEY